MKDINRTHIRQMVPEFNQQLNQELSLLINQQYSFITWRQLKVELYDKISSALFYYVEDELND